MVVTALHIATLTVFLDVVGPIVGARGGYMLRGGNGAGPRSARCSFCAALAPESRRLACRTRGPPWPIPAPNAVAPSTSTARAIVVYKTTDYG